MRRIFLLRTRPLLSAALSCALVGAICPAAHARRDLSLSAAVSLALKNNPQLHLESAKVDEAEAQRKSTRGLYGPKLSAEANLMLWDSALAFEFAAPDMNELMAGPNGGTFLKYGDLLLVLGDLFDLGNIRDQVTAQASVTLAQPLTPLLQIHQGYVAQKRMAQAARLDKQTKQLEVVKQVTETYLKLMQATRFAEIAQSGVQQVEAHLKQAQHFYAAGLIGKQDVLKAQLELARAKERVIQARTGISLARAGLALLLGLGIDADLHLTETVPDPPPPLSTNLKSCVRRGLEQRSELASLARKREAAAAGRKSAGWDMLPQVSAVASYQYTHGQGTFMPENAFFVGGVLEWDIWDWGKKYYARSAAAHKEHQAALGARLMRDGVQLQIHKAFMELRQSDEALKVARVAITEAEENFRIEKKRFEANANTSTDVLDAQLVLTRAQLSYTTALYGYYVARAALARAMGQRPAVAKKD